MTSHRINSAAGSASVTNQSARPDLEKSSCGLPVSLPPSISRWTALRKAAVISAVNAGELRAEDACSRFGISAEEFEAWATGFANHGLSALRVTHRSR